MRDGLVSKEDLEAILAEQRDSRTQRITGRRLGELLVERGVVTQAQVTKLVAEQYELPYVELKETDIDLRVATALTEELAERFSALPIRSLHDGSVLLAIGDPATVLFSDELRRVLGAPLRFAVVGPDAVEAAIQFVHRRGSPASGSPLAGNDPHLAAADNVLVELYSEETDGEAHDGPTDALSSGSERVGTHLWPPLGALLIREGLVTDEELEAALAQQRISGSRRLGEILVERRIVTRADVARLVAEQYELPFIALDPSQIDPLAATLLPEQVARDYAALPTGFLPDGSLRVVVADPTNVLYSDEIHLAVGVPISFAVAAPDAIRAAIANVYRGAPTPDVTLTATPVVVPEPEGPHTRSESAEAEAPATDDGRDQIAADTSPTTFGTGEAPVPFPLEKVEEASVVDEGDEVESEERFEPVATGAFLLDEDGAEPQTIEDYAWVDEIAEPVVVEDVEPFVGEESPAPFVLDETVSAEESAEVPDFPERGADAVEPTTEAEEPPTTGFVEDVAEALVREDALESVPTAELAYEREMGEEPGLPEAQAEVVGASSEVERMMETSVDSELDELVERALSLGASSVHFSPQPQGLVVRARIDGVMRELETLSSWEGKPVTAALDLHGRWAGLQVEVLPTKHGEKVTLRVPVDETVLPFSVGDLGLTPADEETFRRALGESSGLIVVSGPAGSGKTTTLYAALQMLNTPERMLTTIEDPIAHLLPGVDQIEVDPSAGLTFAHGLDTILRSDADVVLVGEIRDEETAKMAFQAARTGHLVLAGVSSPSAAAAVQRLAEMGVDPAVMSTTLTWVVAQRLVRRVCRNCRETYYPTENAFEHFGRATNDVAPRLLARGRGCAACGETGYKGRAGIFEVLPLTDDVRALVAERASTTEIQQAAVALGMRTLQEDGVRLCLEGVTSAAEVQRVAGDDATA